MTLYVASIVEGQTETRCLERLLQRVWLELLAAPERLQVLEPFRGQRDALVHANGLVLGQKVQEAYLKLHAKLRRDSQGRGLLLILLDAENDLPCALAPRLLQTARQARADADISCVLARRMLENWFVAGASTLAGVNGLPDPLPIQDDPEERSGAGWLEEQFRLKDRTRKYTKTADAPAFARAMDLEGCRKHSPSFDKLCRELKARSSQSLNAATPGEEPSPDSPPSPTDPSSA